MATQLDKQLVTVETTEYNPAQVELIKRTVAAGCSNDELALFLEVCRGSGLNPFMKQIYAIKRGDKMTVQTGIDGYRLLAARTGDLAGIDDATYDQETEEHPTWASVTVWRFVRGQRVPFTAKARWREYAQVNRDGNPSGLWGKMPYLMLAKCAESLALRKAFPAELSGVYTAEEMEQADNPTSVPAAYVEATPAAAAQSTQPAPDRVSRALGDTVVLQLLNQMGRRSEPDRRLEMESVFDALDRTRQVVTLKAIKAELASRVADQTSQTPDLATLDTGSIGA